jgi:hypothetical protein
MASATDPAQWLHLARKQERLANNLKDANEQAAAFTEGSKFEQVSNS